MSQTRNGQFQIGGAWRGGAWLGKAGLGRRKARGRTASFQPEGIKNATL